MSATVFLDTVGLLALWDKADQWHQAADSAFFSLAKDRSPIVTSTYVLLECGNAASRRPYRAAVIRLVIHCKPPRDYSHLHPKIWKPLGRHMRVVKPVKQELSTWFPSR